MRASGAGYTGELGRVVAIPSRMTKLNSIFAVLFAFSTWIACDKADEVFDCAQICNRYSDCFDADYDVGECVDRCEDNAANDDAFSDAADACENCLDDRSCTGSFACADECIGIVP